MNKALVSIFLLGISLVFSLLFVWRSYEEFALLRSERKEKEQELIQREQYVTKLKELAEQLQEHKEKVALIEAALPEERNIPSLYELMETVASQSGLVLKSVSAEQKDIGGTSKLKATGITIDLEGSYPAVKQFLQAAKKNARLLQVKDFSLAAPKEEGAFKFTAHLDAYSY